MATVRCPECGARVRMRDDARKLRCPECDRSFRPPDDEDDADDTEERPSRSLPSRPRTRRARSSHKKVVVAVVGVLVLVAVVVAVVLIARKGGKDGKESAAPIDSAKVTIPNFRSLRTGMSLAEVEVVLGGSRPSSEDDVTNTIRRDGHGDPNWLKGRGFDRATMQQITSWRKWEGKNDVQVWVAFIETPDGEKAVLSISMEPFEYGGLKIQLGFSSDASEAAKESKLLKEENAIRNDAKWVRGPKAREWLVGDWTDSRGDGYIFGADGKVKEVNSFTTPLIEVPDDGFFPAKPPPTYRVVDDNHLEIHTPSPFPNHPPTVAKFEFYVNQYEMALIGAKLLGPEGDTTIRPHFRLPITAGSPGESKFLTPMLADLKSNDGSKRNMAYEGLRRRAKGLTIALPDLMQLMRNADPSVAYYVAFIIGNMKEKAASAVPELIALLSDSNPRRVTAAMHCLGQLGPLAKDAVPTLRVLAARARDKEVRELAPGVIGDIENPRN